MEVGLVVVLEETSARVGDGLDGSNVGVKRHQLPDLNIVRHLHHIRIGEVGELRSWRTKNQECGVLMVDTNYELLFTTLTV